MNFAELLATLIDEENVKKHYKNRLVGTVLNGYLSLRKLVVQRTKLIDETQEKLLELLEEMTTGEEKEIFDKATLLLSWSIGSCFV